MRTLHVFFLTLLSGLYFSALAQDFKGVPYGPESRQYVDIYTAPSATPTPVYFDAHGNGGRTNMPSAIINDLKAAGISTVAWESLTSVSTPAEVETGWADAELMFAWVKANAATYNFDTSQFIIGGSSRGSILSWKYAHHAGPHVKGLYMYNALPDGVWADTTWWYPPNEVNALSKPLFLVYEYEPGTTNSHDPNNGVIIMDTYEALGIGDLDTLVHSIASSGNDDKYQFLVDFALSVINQQTATSLAAAPQLAYKAYPNPFGDELHIAGLRGGERFVLRSAYGQEIQEGKALEVINLSSLSPGIYFLRIEREDAYSTLKLVKR